MKQLHGIRILVALLCLLLVVAVFAACNGSGSGDESTDAGNTPGETTGNGGAGTTGGSGETEKDEPKDTINVSDYFLVIPDDASDSVNDAATALILSANTTLGADFAEIGLDSVVNPGNADPNAYEILVGNTSRPESAQALDDLGGKVGYVIKKIGNKIVINASAPGLLDEAAQYFVSTFMDKGTAGAFELPIGLSLVKNDMDAVALFDDNGNVRYTLVYSDSLDVTSGANDKDKTDYVVPGFLAIQEALQKKFSIDNIPFQSDSTAASADAYEILLGRTNRPETEAFLSTLKVNEYGYGIYGNKIVIAGWSALTIEKAANLFIANFPRYIVESGNSKNLVMVGSDRMVEAYEEWNLEVPLYTGGKLTGADLLFTGSYQAYYSSTSADEFRAYRTALESAGYKLHQENQIGNNLYATYYNDLNMIHTYYVNYNNTVRVIVEAMENVVLPQNEDSYEKITDMTFTMMNLDDAAGNFGNAFILTLEDGSFILHDGGGDKGTFKYADRDELYNLLKRLNKRPDGKIVIAAWIISHQHWDHFKNAHDMFAAYYRNGNMTVEKVIYNVGSATTTYNSNNPGTYIEQGYLNNLKLWFGTEQVVMHTGQTIQLRNLKLEVMYTSEDLYPQAIVKFNNSSFVHRFDVGEGNAKQRMMIMGDIEEVASQTLVKMYGDELKCDIMQVAHHGYGGSVELYKRFSPSVVLWPKDSKAVNNQLTGTGYYPTINQSLVNQTNVLLVVIADGGHKMIYLPVTGLTSNRDTNLKDCVTVLPREDGLPT